MRGFSAERGDKVGVDAVEVGDGGNEGEEVAAYEFLLGTPEANFSLINHTILVRMRRRD
jgi:hypothetical protein